MDIEETKGRWYDLDRVLLTESSMSSENYMPCYELKEGLFSTPILCIGAGGLGCEILKNLALSGMKQIHVIDLDTIDVTNLNRQFLFRQKDVGQGKAEVAARVIMERVRDCKVIAYRKRIQEFPRQFYEQFPVIIAGLDNVEARRWINRMVINMVEEGRMETMHYLVDGGTEGLNGQARVIAPYKSACYECTLQQLPKQTQYQMCTIANTPRLPEHCIAYAYEVLWNEHFGDRKMDKDSYEDMNWVYEEALKRGEQFGIKGVTYKLTMGVVKNIIPAVASTNALIAASCVNEAFKILTGNGEIMDNYFKWIGQAEFNGVNTTIISQEREQNCGVCQIQRVEYLMKENEVLEGVLTRLREKYDLTDPCMSTEDKKILYTNIDGLKEHHNFKLKKSLRELMDMGLWKEGEKIICLDPQIATSIEVSIKLFDQQLQQQQQQ